MGANGPFRVNVKNTCIEPDTGQNGLAVSQSKPVISLIGHGQRQIKPGFQ